MDKSVRHDILKDTSEREKFASGGRECNILALSSG